MFSRFLILAAAVGALACPLRAGGAAEGGAGAADEPLSVHVDPQVMAAVRDRTIGQLPFEEREAYYSVLRHAQRVPQPAQREAAREHRSARIEAVARRYRERPEDFPVFVDLFKNPQEYRGKPVTLRGHVRKCISYPADENDHGIATLYETWLFPGDGQQNPAVVISTSVPEGMPLGEHIQEQAAVTGYFFKMFGYEAQDTTRVAPLILAARLEWTPSPAGPPFVPPPLVYGLAAALLAAVVWFVWRTGRRDRAFRNRLPHAADRQEPDLSGIEE